MKQKIQSGNMAEILHGNCVNRADVEAIHCPSSWDNSAVIEYESITYSELKIKVSAYQAGLKNAKFVEGDRIIVLFTPCVDLYCLVIAMLASGIIPVFIDTGMSLKKFFMGIKDSRASAIISTHKVLRYRFFVPALWHCAWYSVDKTGFGVRPLNDLYCEDENNDITICRRTTDDHGLITFTSGSTGRPKGADRTHGSLIMQYQTMEETIPGFPEDIDMISFPVVALHSLVGGKTVVFPAINMASPGTVNPALIVKQLTEFNVNRLIAAPKFLERMAEYIIEHKVKLPLLRDVITGGAPVSPMLCRKLKSAFPGAVVKVLYGSTEAEPISSVLIDEIISSQNRGLLVGKPLPFAEVRIVMLPDNPHDITDHSLNSYMVETGESGELVVRGNHVLKSYMDNPEATIENKIPCPDGRVWHRTGDTGFLDEQGRIWLTGRVADTVIYKDTKVYPYLVELEIDMIPDVACSALVYKNRKTRPVLVVVPLAGCDKSKVQMAIENKLRSLDLDDIPVKFIGVIPVDGRHNSKIDRVKLRKKL